MITNKFFGLFIKSIIFVGLLTNFIVFLEDWEFLETLKFLNKGLAYNKNVFYLFFYFLQNKIPILGQQSVWREQAEFFLDLKNKHPGQ